MAKARTTVNREARRLIDLGIRLVALGGAFVVLPLFLGNSPLRKAFGPLSTIGWVALAGGAVLFALGRRMARRLAAERSVEASADPTRSNRRAASAAANASNDIAAAGESPRALPPLRPVGWSAAVFDVIEWRRFEAVVERLFQQAGFDTRSQAHGADGGVDVWLYSRHQPGDPVSLVQCKHWQGKRVGVDKIRELRGVMASRNVRRGQFATTSTFTPDAIVFARENGVSLLDVDGLLELIAGRSPDEQADLLAVALEGEYWRPTCVNCGVKMVERRPRNRGASFWGCPRYPACKTMLPMRSGTGGAPFSDR